MIKELTNQNSNDNTLVLSENTRQKFLQYNLDLYLKDIENLGLECTWNMICRFVIEFHQKLPSFLNVKNFGKLYEIGLATQDKMLKKKADNITLRMMLQK